MSILKAVKKPIPITVQQFDPERADEMLFRFKRHGSRYLPEAPYQLWNELHKAWIGLKAGDYVNVVDPNDYYPINAATFARTYDVLPEEKLPLRQFHEGAYGDLR